MYITAHLYDLDLLYKLPSHYVLMNYLLDQCYVENKNKVNAQLCAL